MYGADIAQSHNAGELAGTLYGYVIVKHFYLNVRPFNAVISIVMRSHLLCKESSCFSQNKGFFLSLT